MAGELRRALVEQRLGVDITDALEGVGQRMDSEDFDWIVTTKDLADPSYRTYEFGLPMPMVEAARRHTTPAGVQAGLFLYRPRGTPTP